MTSSFKKIGIAALVVFLGCCVAKKQKADPEQDERYSPINYDEGRIKMTELQYHHYEGGHYHVIEKFEDGSIADYEFDLDNPDDFNIWIKQAELDGAIVKTF